jgi:hypothetical protein
MSLGAAIGGRASRPTGAPWVRIPEDLDVECEASAVCERESFAGSTLQDRC